MQHTSLLVAKLKYTAFQLQLTYSESRIRELQCPNTSELLNFLPQELFMTVSVDA